MINKVLYSSVSDGRHNIHALNGCNSERIQEQAKGIACFIQKQNLIQELMPTKYHISTSVPNLTKYIEQAYKYPLGEKEAFCNEPMLAFGTGFLVTPNTLLTAGHVVCHPHSDQLNLQLIKNTYVVFGFFMKDADRCKEEFEEGEVYTIKKVIAHAYTKIGSKWEDWALIKLDRNASGREPLKLDPTPIQMNLGMYMLGHPSGLPLKTTGDGVIKSTKHPVYFECMIDAFGGNSGSPVFREDKGGVVGILCEGNPDYTITHDYQGGGVSRCVPLRADVVQQKTYEKCQRIATITVLADYLVLQESGFKLQQKPYDKNVHAGLSLWGECSEHTCRRDKMWLNCGYGEFRLEELLYLSTCSFCKVGKFIVKDIGLYNCKYKLDGSVQAPKPFRIVKIGKTSKLKGLEQSENWKWVYLKIIASEI